MQVFRLSINSAKQTKAQPKELIDDILAGT